jgi:3-oxosteroid 1-dehydrogenase
VSHQTEKPYVVTLTEELDWDHTADLVVVGTGISGSSTAFNSLRKGASVVMLEKGERTGGTSAKALGGMMVPNNRYMQQAGQDDPKDDFIRFFARIGRPLLYDADAEFYGLPEWEYRIVELYYDNAATAFIEMEDSGGMRTFHADDWPSYNEVDEDKARFGRTLMNHDGTGELVNGRVVIDFLIEQIEKLGGQVLTGHRVDGVFVNEQGEVVGVRASHDDNEVLVRANKAVAFASGGFTHGKRYTQEYLNGQYVGGCAARTNEGDIIPIVKALGVPLFHMHSAWGSPLVFEQALDEDPTLISNFSLIGDSVFSVNKYGKRVVNEKTTYNDRTQSHFLWDPARAEYPNFLQFAILDERTRLNWPRQGMADHQAGNFIPPIGEESKYLMQADTLDELVDLIAARLEKLSKETRGVRLADDFREQLKLTIARFNGFAEAGYDEDFQRGEQAIQLLLHGDRAADNDKPNPTMYPLAETGPYYATILAPGAIETKGGPKVNTQLQILDGSDRPVPGLYGIGNCVASASGQAYWSGGTTFGPYTTFGFVAASAIAAETEKRIGVAALSA